MPENVFSKRVMSALPRCPNEHLFDILKGLAIERDDIITTPNPVSDLELSIETIQNSLRRSPRKLKIYIQSTASSSATGAVAELPNREPHDLRTAKHAVHHCR